MQKSYQTLVTAVFTLVSGGGTLAQEVPNSSQFSFDLVGAAIGSAEVDMDKGDSIQWSRSYFEARAALTLPERQNVGIEIGAGHTEYTFGKGYGGLSSVVVDEFKLSLPIQIPVGERSGIIFVPQLSYAAETGVDLDDGLSYGALVGVAWQLSPDLMIGPALGVQSDLQDEADIFPFLLLDWEFADRWHFSTGSGFAASRGPGLRVAYEASDTWEVGLEARYEQFEFRFGDDGDAPGGTGIDSSVPVVLTSRWSPNETVTFSGFVGAALGGSYTVTDRRDNEIAKSDYDPAPIFGVLARVEF